MQTTDMLTYVLRDVDHGITDSVRIAAADRIEALEADIASLKATNIAFNTAAQAHSAWKAEAMEVLRPFAAYKTADGIDGGDFLRIPDGHPVLFNGMGDDYRVVVNIGHLRAARRLVEQEDGR